MQDKFAENNLLFSAKSPKRFGESLPKHLRSAIISHHQGRVAQLVRAHGSHP